MKSKVSLAGLVSGALMALLAGLLVSHYSFAWLLMGVAVGMVMGAALVQRGPQARLQKGEQR